MRERIIDEIKRIASEIGRPPGKMVFAKMTGIKPSQIEGTYWATWGDALADAGFQPNGLQAKFNIDELLGSIAAACLAFGKFPTANELKLHARGKPKFPSHSTIDNHFPRRSLLVEALRDWLLKPENCEYASIVDMLPSAAKIDEPASKDIFGGHVYLIKAGDFYKIGRSDQLERRVKEIRTALPQAATLEHTIATDDPPGIEAYWHRRFADRRANGEWFQLSKTDVLAFKKRKFQ